MNTDKKQNRNPLVRDGVSQQNRHIVALEPSYVKVDEQDLTDFLVFAYQLSENVKYYNSSNHRDGNWRSFFERSTSVQIAQIMKTRSDELREKYNEALQDFFNQWTIAPAVSPKNMATSPRLAKLEKVLNVLADVLKQLQIWYTNLDYTTPLKPFIRDHVKADLEIPFQRLFALDEKNPYLSNLNDGTTNRKSSYEKFGKAFFNFQASDQVRGDESTSRLRTLITNRKVAKEELDSIFQPLFQTYIKIIDAARNWPEKFAQPLLEQSLYGDQNLSPHLALYVAFWEIFKLAQDDLNRMTQRHLDFFYREVLHLSEKPAEPDKAHIILELAKAQDPHKLESQTRFSAGKDATGADLFYVLNDEIVVDRAQIGDLKSIFLHRDETQEKRILGLHVSPKANSLDDKGAEFPKDDPTKAWLPFGNESRPTANVGLVIASNILLLGEGDRTITFQFNLSVQPLSLKDIEQLKKDLEQPKEGQTHRAFRVDFSGQKAWIEGNVVDCSLSPKADNTTLYTLTLKVHLPVGKESVCPYHVDLPGAKFTVPVIPANQEAPIKQLPPNSPVVRIILRHKDKQTNTEQTGAGTVALLNQGAEVAEPVIYHYLRQATLKGMTITVDVKGVRNLLLQNDLGVLDATKPFQPFGPLPKVGGNFYIGSQEVFQKKLTELQLFFDLETDPPREDKPQDPESIDWSKIYAAYNIDKSTTDRGNTQSKLWPKIYAACNIGGGIFNPGQFVIQALREGQWHPPDSATPPTVVRENLFLINSSQTNHRRYQINLTKPFEALNLTQRVKTPSEELALTPWTHESKYGFLRWQLIDDDFLHGDYPAVLARQVLATATQDTIEVPLGKTDTKEKSTGSRSNHEISAESAGRPNIFRKFFSWTGSRTTKKRKAVIGAYYKSPTGNIFRAEKNYVDLDDQPILPDAPYTPVITSLQIDYSAEADLEDCQLFHLYPFDGFLTLSNSDVEQKQVYFLPQFADEGELLIGLTDLEPASSLSLLFQLAEGTAKTVLLQQPKIEWHYLSDNTWLALEDYRVCQDTSGGLSHTGIVQISIPQEIRRSYTTILDPSFHWVKVSVAAGSAALPNIINIQTQAAEVTFLDTGNDPFHLASPLPAESITKLVDSQPEIKQIQQPSPSFGGKIKEQSDAFYVRVSEHLRHKGRAITIFDYERLVLERFPEIAKVLCVNHAKFENETMLEITPGYVTLVVIPKLADQPKPQDLAPKVNARLLRDIKEYLEFLSSPWLKDKIHIVNPNYEKIKVDLSVQLKDPFQDKFSYYERQLQEKIVGFLSPWMIDREAEMNFSGELYLSSLLQFLQGLEYVEYVLDLKMYQDENPIPVSKAIASTAYSILVSAPLGDHTIRKASEQDTENITRMNQDRTELGSVPLEPDPTRGFKLSEPTSLGTVESGLGSRRLEDLILSEADREQAPGI